MNLLSQALTTLPGKWTKHAMHNGDKSCSLGHISKADKVLNGLLIDVADPYRVDFYKAVDTLVAVAHEMFPDREFETVAGFNDHDATTEADVVAVFEKAAIKLDEAV
jgi:hypothetical protein